MKPVEKNKGISFSRKVSGISSYFSNLLNFNLYRNKHIICLNAIKCRNLILILSLFTFFNSYSDNFSDEKETSKSLIYNIVRNDEVIGKIEINLSTIGDSVTYDIDSDVLAKFILKFKVVGKEKYIYKNGILVYSSQFRTLNDRVKTNHSILYQKGRYSFQTPEKTSSLNFEAIKCNIIKLFINEPVGINTVFCDNQQQMLKVESLGIGIYKVEFSKGKYNIFHYKNGRCVKIKAVSPLFDVTLIPVLS